MWNLTNFNSEVGIATENVEFEIFHSFNYNFSADYVKNNLTSSYVSDLLIEK